MKLTYIDENASHNNKKRTIQSQKQKGRKSYLGVKESEAKYIVHMNLYEHHYFIEEKTPFSSYYINNIDTETIENYNKRFVNGKSYKLCKEGRLITSSNMVRILMKSGHFRPITYGEYKVVNTIFHHEIDESLDYDLEYNEKLALD